MWEAVVQPSECSLNRLRDTNPAPKPPIQGVDTSLKRRR